MLHVWLLPALVVLVLALVGLYYAVRCSGGGDGIRRDGQCVCDHEVKEDHAYPSNPE